VTLPAGLPAHASARPANHPSIAVNILVNAYLHTAAVLRPRKGKLVSSLTRTRTFRHPSPPLSHGQLGRPISARLPLSVSQHSNEKMLLEQAPVNQKAHFLNIFLTYSSSRARKLFKPTQETRFCTRPAVQNWARQLKIPIHLEALLSSHAPAFVDLFSMLTICEYRDSISFTRQTHHRLHVTS